MLKAFGSPLCITNSDGNVPDPAGGHSKLPDCCISAARRVGPVLQHGLASVSIVQAFGVFVLTWRRQ